MNTRKLGTLEVSEVGLGCMGMHHAYGAPRDEKEMEKLIHKAVDLGITFFDTAELYEAKGQPHGNELLVGRALAPYRGKVKIATKFGLASNENHELLADSRPETVRKSVEGSLQRLGVDCLDLYYQHRVDPKIPVEEVALTMAELIKEGKIAHWGMCEANAEQIRKAHAVCPLTAVQNRYSMMARWHESLFPVLEELGIGYVAFSPLANGFLSAKYNSNSQFDGVSDYRSIMPQFTGEGVDQNQELLALLHRMAKEKDATSAQISLAWMLCKKPYLVPIPGSRKVERMQENADAANVVLTAEEVKSLDEALDTMEMSDVFGGSQIKKN